MKTNDKIIFSLSPLSALINGLILISISSLIWSITLVKQVPQDIKVDSETTTTIQVDVPWYIELPFLCLGMFMIMRWSQNKFKEVHESNNYAKMFTYDAFTILFCAVFSMLMKIIFTITLLILFR